MADDDGSRRYDLPGPQANPAETVAGDLHGGDLALDNADAAGRKLLGVRGRGIAGMTGTESSADGLARKLAAMAKSVS